MGLSGLEPLTSALSESIRWGTQLKPYAWRADGGYAAGLGWAATRRSRCFSAASSIVDQPPPAPELPPTESPPTVDQCEVGPSSLVTSGMPRLLRTRRGGGPKL